MVFFCPDCTYTLGINKSTQLEASEDRKKIDTVSDVYKLISKVDFNDYIATFSKKDLLVNKKYQKMSQEEKNKIDKLFLNKLSEADLACSNCGYKKQINETIKLYEFNVFDKSNSKRNLDDNKLLTMDPILPRTRDYVCKNVNCITHKDPSIREAVFMKIPKSYSLSYICCVCHYSWDLV